MLDLKNARSLTQALGFWQRTLLQLRFDLNFIELCPCVCVCVLCFMFAYYNYIHVRRKTVS